MASNYYLSETYLLKGATLGDIDAIDVVCETRDLAPDETLVKVGEASQDIMIILEGRVKVVSASGQEIGEFRQGNLIGEIAFLDKKPRTASLIATNPCKVLIIPADRLRQLTLERPGLAAVLYRNIAMALCDRLRLANEQIDTAHLDETAPA
ncbi:MAG TPA: cyclic nucleotide-binding domain-containing protein [Fimbriimonadaceae bacterium]|nr:cyclic nucleotide-binding domain-containing protein [Fimbriimonadaceae bacterium]HRJ33389.1 cyclic nucleotide-binding domain-containing protein [Fimbriimonadaceae bacterium]